MLITRTGYSKRIRVGMDNVFRLSEDIQSNTILLVTPFIICNIKKEHQDYNYYLNFIRECEYYELEITKNGVTFKSDYK